MLENYNDYCKVLLKQINKDNPIEIEKIKKISKFFNTNLTDKKIKEYTSFSQTTSKYELKELINSKIFIIDEDIKKLLIKTDNKIYNRPFPYDNFFIDVFLKFKNEKDEATYKGLHIRKDKFGSFIKTLVCPQTNGTFIENFGMMGVIPFIDSFDYDEHKKIFSSYNIAMNKFEGLIKHNYNEVKLFVCNFLDFLNNPEVEIVTVERTKEQNEKRILRGKLPIPPINYIRITGKLKIYLDQLKSGKHFSYSHRFWVRGHFRSLRSEKWKKARGTKIWILPYIKGKGILINKNYLVENKNTKVEVKPNETMS